MSRETPRPDTTINSSATDRTDARTDAHTQSHAVNEFDPTKTAVQAMVLAEDHKASRIGLRSIAIFEAAKGLLVLFVGLGLSSYLHHDAQHAIESITRHFRLNPAHRIPGIFITALTSVSNINLWVLALGALAYSLVRFIEAYGLWHQKVWAEWFAIASGGVYLPFELYELTEHYSPVKLAITVFNVLLVVYLVWQRLRQEREAERAAERARQHEITLRKETS